MADVSLPQWLATEGAALMLGAAVLGMLARRLGVPYAVALVLGGLLIEAARVTGMPRLDPGVLLFGLLPPLLFDAAFRLDLGEARPAWLPITYLALPGTLLTALVVGVSVALFVGLPLTIGLLFGSVVAATDPVAVVGVFRSLRAPARPTTIAESESLINDGVAITLYTALATFALGHDSSVGDALTIFAREMLGGVVIGLAAGFVFSRLTAMVDDHLIEMLLSVALAYGSYVTAQWVDASGPLACVAAGLVHGGYGRRVGMSASTRRLLDDLWEFLGFAANAAVFLMIGFTVNLESLVGNAWACSVAIVVVLLARIALLLGPGTFLRDHHLVTTAAERLVLAWSGLRGALTITLVLALSEDTPYRDVLLAMSFAVVLFTLVVQALTLPLLLRRLGLVRRPTSTSVALADG